MKIEVQCTTCETPHFDHYECDNCHHNVDNYGSFWTKEEELELIANRWLYCPWCGRVSGRKRRKACVLWTPGTFLESRTR